MKAIEQQYYLVCDYFDKTETLLVVIELLEAEFDWN